MNFPFLQFISKGWYWVFIGKCWTLNCGLSFITIQDKFKLKGIITQLTHVCFYQTLQFMWSWKCISSSSVYMIVDAVHEPELCFCVLRTFPALSSAYVNAAV